MSGYKLKNVFYLQDRDFNEDGSLKVPHDKPVVLGVVASWCGYCQRMKQAFQDYANLPNKPVYVAVIQTDGATDGEKALGSKVRSIVPTFQGFPTVVKLVNGRVVETFEDERTLEGFQRFASN